MRLIPIFAAVLGMSGATLAQSPEPCPPPVAEAQREEAVRQYQAGTTSALAQQWEKALPALEQASRLDPRIALAHFARGQALMALKRYREAVQAYLDCRAAFRCAPELSEAEKAEARQRLEREKSEVREALRSLDGRRHVEQSVLARGAMLGTDGPRPASGWERVHQLELRLHELERWLQADTTRPPAALSVALGNAYFQSGSLPEAEREFRSTLLADPDSGDAHNNLAVVLMVTGRAEEAEREAKLAEKAGVPVSPRLLEEIRKRRVEAKPAPD